MPSDALPLERIENPWLRAFLAAPWEEMVIGQVTIRRTGSGFELRHIADAPTPERPSGPSLQSLRSSDARAWANFNADGAFRPLKSTPDLKSGWILHAGTPEEVAEALNGFYPNALADLFAARQTPAPVTRYREFTSRQTGMYRITTFLGDAEVGDVIEKTCNTICLKRRLWTVGNLAADAENKKSIIPCLEPCAILLETARKTVRALQERSAAGGSVK